MGKPRPREGGREDGLRLPSEWGQSNHSTGVPSSQVLSPPTPGSDGSESNSGQVTALSGDGTTLVIFKVTEQQNEGDATTSPGWEEGRMGTSGMLGAMSMLSIYLTWVWPGEAGGQIVGTWVTCVPQGTRTGWWPEVRAAVPRA